MRRLAAAVAAAAVALVAGVADHATCSRTPGKNLTAQWLLDNHALVCDERVGTKACAGDTLGYVTPWNSRGYEYAKTYARKFTYISPVWLQLRLTADGEGVEVTGQHDVDAGWMRDVRTAGGCGDAGTDAAGVEADGTIRPAQQHCTLIVPRVAWEVRKAPSAELFDASVAAVLAAVVAHGFDGVVLESPTASVVYKPLITGMATALHSHGGRKLYFIQVLPPTATDETGRVYAGIPPEAYAELATVCDGFSLMTYDYSSSRGFPDGPNAPLWWAEESVRSLIPASLPPETAAPLLSKLLLGVPFYGYDSGEAILGPAFLKLLQAHPHERMKYEKKAEEHVLQYYDGSEEPPRRRTVHYPTPYFVSKRVELVNRLGMGVSVWELGQGLECLFDQL